MPGIRLKGKNRLPLDEYFMSILTYDLERGCEYDEAFESLVDRIAPPFRAFMTKENVYVTLVRIISDFEDDLREGRTEVNHLSDELIRVALVDRIVDELAAYPKRYEMRLSLPTFRHMPPIELQLGDDLSLEFTGRDRKNTPAFLKFKFSGFFDGNTSTLAVMELFRAAKIFVFHLQSIGLSFPGAYIGVSEGEVREIEGGWHPIVLPQGVAHLLGGAKLHLATLIKLSGGRIESEDDFGVGFARITESFFSFFEAIRKPQNESIAAAIEWYEDSMFVDNQTVAFLEVCIGLEAILGDPEQKMNDMTNRLCDRLAYTLGRSTEDRRDLFQSYKKLLNTRGSLVHAKQPRLNEEDFETLSNGRALLRRLIEHELALQR